MNVIRKRRTWLALFLVAIVLCVVFHRTLLPLVARPVARLNEDLDENFDAATHLLMLRASRNSEPAFEYAAAFSKANPNHRVLVIKDYVRRAEAIGAEASFLNDTIAMLTERGVPRKQIEIIGDGLVITTAEQLRHASGWLEQQPPTPNGTDLHLQIATHRLNTGYVADSAKHAVPTTLRHRMHLLGFDRAGINENNWWKSTRGLKRFIRANLRLAHLRIFGETRPDIDWDPDEYEANLMALKQNG